MKKAIVTTSALVALAFLALSLLADTRLPEYGQVVGISNQVMAVDAKIASLTPSESYPGSCRVSFQLQGYTPSAAVQEAMLGASFVKVSVGNNVYRYTLASLSAGTTVSTVISVSGSAVAYVEFEAPTVSGEQLLATRRRLKLVEGGTYSVPITLRKADRALFAIGRAQKIADTTTMASFLITRDCATTNAYAPVTLYGYYENSGTSTTWVDETGVRNAHPSVASDGTVTGEVGDFEDHIFPWCAAEKRVVYSGFTDATAKSEFHFSWVPMYYWRLEDVTLPIRTHNAANDTWTTNSVACRVHWVSESPLPGFSIPPWGYIHAYDGDTGTYSTPYVKDGFYYSRYASVTKNGKAQAYPWAAKDTAYTRADIMTLCHNLNAYTSRVTGGTATNQTYAADASNRLWAGPMYENYAPFRELAYIQFGASMKSAFYGGPWVEQNVLSGQFEAAPNIKTFDDGTTGAFAWLYISNPFYSSEGEVMCDASYVARKDDGGNQYGEWYVCPDRAASIGGATTIEAIEAAGGFKLGYALKGLGITSMETARCIDETSLQSSIYWFPGCTTAKCCVRVTDESGWYGGAPAAAGGVSVYGNWLSYARGTAPQLGLWCVYATIAPSIAGANLWGSRPSFAPCRTEGEARSGGN